MTRPILILLTEGFADWEIALISGAGVAFCGADVRLSSPGGADVTSMGGVRVTGLVPFAPKGGDVVAICGGTAWEAAGGPDLIASLADRLAAARADGAVIAAICGGVRALADLGMLDGVRHTSNGRDWLNGVSPGHAGSGLHVDQPQALRDCDIITAPGSAPVSFASEVLKAAGVPADQIAGLRRMLSAEHTAA